MGRIVLGETGEHEGHFFSDYTKEFILTLVRNDQMWILNIWNAHNTPGVESELKQFLGLYHILLES